MKSEDTTVPEPNNTQEYLFRVWLGTYERLLYGYTVTQDPEELVLQMDLTVAYAPHIGSVRCLAASPSGKYLASAGVDEQIRLYDAVKRRELGTLNHHSGTLTGLYFYKDQYLLTCAEDGKLAIVRVSDWEMVKELRPVRLGGRKQHQKQRRGKNQQADEDATISEPLSKSEKMMGMAVHPSGKVALTLHPGALSLFDLTRARFTYSISLKPPVMLNRKEEPICVKFDVDGSNYAVLFPSQIQLFSLASAGDSNVRTVNAQRGERFSSIEFISAEYIAVGTQAGSMQVFDYSGPDADVKRVLSTAAHKNRIKDLSVLDSVYLLSVSSDGIASVWDIPQIKETCAMTEDQQKSHELESLVSVETGSRLVCCAFQRGPLMDFLEESEIVNSEVAEEQPSDTDTEDQESDQSAETEEETISPKGKRVKFSK